MILGYDHVGWNAYYDKNRNVEVCYYKCDKYGFFKSISKEAHSNYLGRNWDDYTNINECLYGKYEPRDYETN